MKIMITGGAGFIGSALIRFLIKETQETVINVDKLTYASCLKSVEKIANSERYTFAKVDVCDANKLRELFQIHQPDAVMHLAAESHVDQSIKDSQAFIQTNILGSYVLLEAARSYWESLREIKKKNFRFHHISTDEVYGDLENFRSGSTELTPYAPSSPYSASKASADHLVKAWHRTYGLPVLLTHSSNNYGPYQFPEKLIPLIILNALAAKPLPIYGDGRQIRDWLYVEDHVRALYLVLKKGQIGESYNIGAQNEKKNIEVAEIICSLLEDYISAKSLGLKCFADLICYVKDRPGHDRRYALNTTKIMQTLNWRPKESFMSGIRKTLEWYLKNSNWLSEVSLTKRT